MFLVSFNILHSVFFRSSAAYLLMRLLFVTRVHSVENKKLCAQRTECSWLAEKHMFFFFNLFHYEVNKDSVFSFGVAWPVSFITKYETNARNVQQLDFAISILLIKTQHQTRANLLWHHSGDGDDDVEKMCLLWRHSGRGGLTQLVRAFNRRQPSFNKL